METKETNENDAIAIIDEASEIEPNGEPKKPHLNFETATYFANRVRQDLCKNAVIEVVDTGKEEKVQIAPGKYTLEVSYDIRSDGCQNKRRNGSAFCQECSDKHKQNI